VAGFRGAPGGKRAEYSLIEIEAIRHKDLPIYGIQFHPEVAHTGKGKEIYRNFVSLCKI